ncbi:PDZ domain-containing protein [Streptomyces sp. 2224.1]|uniref:S16 family serine protease n=1 Tax=unclassified Streptomyces TaxID=2593676 RepID=UPI0008865B04|nr:MULTISPECIES: S16 family serine protease [unclassified Streptomyces]PBC82666.1 PDZ domain-containing protein [Streptomyces sp. 2321.6]SDR48130.1 PDZ domain-containing protein [Streptomyces sp. KS_16]SEC37989.1 PDZ domain-containing protein [Streptomyces sp. 2224.1]SEC66960.1 PDZ domain-containing protein [Streptomyces sp. 2133.1]SEE94160.1 PDZ domain-containing protein [Streptomyces sp. 2112.3]
MSSRTRALALCSALVLALVLTAVLAPLPFAVAYPGMTANVLGNDKGKPVITITGAGTRKTSGQLRMTSIVATGPDASVHLPDIIEGWFRTDEAVMPREAVYPVGNNTEEIAEHNARQMEQSQDTATSAALGQLGKSAKDIKVKLSLADVGGPSAGLMFALGIVDRLDGDGAGHDLTGGRTIAGTGTITAGGKVGAVGGVPLKTQAAHRDGASVFLVPRKECADAQAELPKGMRLIPVTTLDGAVDALKALRTGGKLPSC